MKYKINENFRVGFPDTAFTKVINTLEDKKINYQVVSKDSETIIKDYGKLNKYKKVLKNAREFQNIAERANMIKEKLENIEDINKLTRILEVIEDELQV